MHLSTLIAAFTLTLAAPIRALAGEAADLSGAELYSAFCASCHGATARGDGPNSKSLGIRVPDLILLAKRNRGRFPASRVYRVVDGRLEYAAHGPRQMPVWGRELYAYDGEDPVRRARVKELIARLVEYLHSIQASETK